MTEGGLRVLGTGIDITDVARVQDFLERWGERFVRRCFSDAEAAYCDRKKRGRAECYAARWAAKEALWKALGGTPGKRIWKDVEVTRDGHGKPSLVLSGYARTALEALGVARTHLSLTHDAGLAVAMVVIEG